MKLLDNALAIIMLCTLVVVVLSLAYFISSTLPAKHTVRYDCGMAEWHPDIPTAAREQCRNRHKVS